MSLLLAEGVLSLTELAWKFANSPVGVSLVSAVCLWIISRVFVAQPEWEKTFNQYKGLFFDAVRHAENSIPDSTGEGAGAKADLALKFILTLEGPLSKKSETTLRQGITQAVAEGASDKVNSV